MPRTANTLGTLLTAAALAGATALPGLPAAAQEAGPAPLHEPSGDFQQVTLAKGVAEVGEPMSIAVLPDRSVLHTSRDGTVRRTDATGLTSVVGKLDVYTHDEEGLQGVAVDPDFSTNRWVYLYYAPPLDTPSGDAPEVSDDPSVWEKWRGYNQLSRFRLTDDFRLDLSSEQKILQVPTDRGICCHVGGDIDFDAEGNLYLTTGDDTNPFQSDNYTPIDERTNRNPSFDAQRTSANTNDLRGKLLRIKVNEDGSYSIPKGNMFAPGTPNTRPEIYAMGFRNPFRMSVDRKTGAVYIGDYGPDAPVPGERGPAGQVEFNRVTGPGFYGWPYCTGGNTVEESYADYDFATGTIGPRFDCQVNGPVNDSPRNTGLQQLPVPVPAWQHYSECTNPAYGCSGAEAPMGGPVYHYDPDLDSPVKFPAEYDGQFFAGDFSRQKLWNIEVNPDGSAGEVHEFPWAGTQPMDLEFGPDGALYVLDYGLSWFGGDLNSALYRIEYTGISGHTPEAKLTASTTSGYRPLRVEFSAEGTHDADGDELTYQWDFGDGKKGPKGKARPGQKLRASHVYRKNGQYRASVIVTDSTGRSHSASTIITVGNHAPVITVQNPPAGLVFTDGDSVPYQVTVTDQEDTTIDCSKVRVSFVLGHDNHGHPLSSTSGCSGTIRAGLDGHGEGANVFGVITFSYTDQGASGVPALTGETQVVVQPRTRQAEHFGEANGVQVVSRAGAGGGSVVSDVQDGDWIAFSPYHLGNVTSFTARVASAGAGGTLELRAGAPDGALVGSAEVTPTGDWETFTDVTGTVSGAPADSTTLYLVFRGGSGDLFELDRFTLTTS